MAESGEGYSGSDVTGEVLRLIAAALIGAAVGAAVGLLFAPKPGRELREDLKTKADEAKGLVSEKAAAAKAKAAEVAQTVKEKTASLKREEEPEAEAADA